MSKSLNARIERLSALLEDEPPVRIRFPPWAVPNQASAGAPAPSPAPAPEPEEPDARCPECRAARDALGQSVPPPKRGT